jgi:L-ascorbate metabolism protein UlaG (beta-lactamase superfamily)
MRKEASIYKVLKDFLNKPATTIPTKPLPSIKTDLSSLQSDVPTIVWFGHSSYLIKSKGMSILVDPVFSGHASPISFFGKEFEGTNVYGVNEMPAIDLLILSHDHYDHLDYETIKRLHPKIKKIVAPLGVDAHLEHWDVPTEKITALNWWESVSIEDSLELISTPARHFSGRGIARGKTLWSAFVLKIHGYSVFIGGDSGYDSQFKSIGEKFGPFDIALLECGQYGEDWPSIHMLPEEVPLAAKDLNAKVLMPVHWAKFALAYHAWNEPIERLLKKADEVEVNMITPKIGEPVIIGQSQPTETWWRF